MGAYVIIFMTQFPVRTFLTWLRDGPASEERYFWPEERADRLERRRAGGPGLPPSAWSRYRNPLGLLTPYLG